MEIALFRSYLSRSSSQSDERNSATMREGEKQALRLFQRESQAAFHYDKKSYYVKNNGEDLLFIWGVFFNMIRYDIILPKNAKVIWCSVKMCSYAIFKRVNPSRNCMWASRHLGTELFNYSIVAAYGLASAERLVVSRAKLVQARFKIQIHLFIKITWFQHGLIHWHWL